MSQLDRPASALSVILELVPILGTNSACGRRKQISQLRTAAPNNEVSPGERLPIDS
jgi:hypothetical protein